jgi:hypothetical protein
VNTTRISPARELGLLIGEAWAILVGDMRNLIISLLFPPAAAAIVIWIAGENMFVSCESSKSACFIIVCAAIWGGLFNSIQTIVKERDNVKRDYVSGALRIGCYTASRAIVQFGLCVVQSTMLCLSFWGIRAVYGNELPAEGLLFSSVIFEYYITVLLIMYSADTLGLMISCFVKSEQLASQLSPYILIVQLLFSGVLFEMKGKSEAVSALMLSRWGMEALGGTTGLNELPLALQKEFPMIPHKPVDAFLATQEHLVKVWLILLLFVFVPLIAGTILLRRVKDDTR